MFTPANAKAKKHYLDESDDDEDDEDTGDEIVRNNICCILSY